jgi:hypothetical protein
MLTVCCLVCVGLVLSATLARNLGPDRADIPIRVTFTITRPRIVNATYFIDIYGATSGVNHNAGARLNSTAVFVCPSCAVTVPHKEITCTMPPGFGGQLEWTVQVLDRLSVPFRCVFVCVRARVFVRMLVRV